MKHPYKFFSYKLLSRFNDSAFLINASAIFSKKSNTETDSRRLFEKRPIVPLIKSRRNENREQIVVSSDLNKMRRTDERVYDRCVIRCSQGEMR